MLVQEILFLLNLVIALLKIGLIFDAVSTDNIRSTILLRRLSLLGLFTVVTLKTIDLTLSKLTGFGAMLLNR